MSFTESQFFRRRFRFETEYGQHRNWWVRDPRIAGNPLSIYLFLLSHDPDRMPSQTEALDALHLGRSAWQSAKERLLRAGFMLEIRDRYPAGYVDGDGRPRGGQKRFRLELLDPEPGIDYALEDVVLELDIPLEEYAKSPGQSQCGKSALDGSDHCGKSALDAKPQISSTAENPHWASASADNPQSFIGREKGLVRLGSNFQTDQTVPTVASAREAIDAQLAELVPTDGAPLTVAAIEREVDGRVDVDEIDLVQAVRDTVLRAAGGSRNPAAYVASVIVRKPDAWRLGAMPAQPGAFLGAEPSVSARPSTAELARAAELAGRASCGRGEHDWGPASWPAIDRAHCQRTHCLKARREVDAAFAALEAAEFERSR